ncbi:MAG: ABC transporter ATP-binding protein [archaeon GB-1867-035]|nr:ABC transporter ATP-binding protein [Candidatus Culexmicrobium profundum]
MNLLSVSCFNVYKYYCIGRNRITALENINLKVNKGEVFCILGPNGSGKTTLLKILSGLMLPDGGAVYILGHDLRKERKIIKSLVNFISGSSMIIGISYHSVIGLLHFYLDFYGVRRSKDRIEKVLEILNLKEYKDENPLLLSSGFKMKLEIAKMFLINTPILLLDEPTIHLDPISANIVRNYIKKLARDYGVTVIWATHFADEIEYFCDKVAILNNGRIVTVDSPFNLREKFLKDVSVVLKVKALNLRESLKKLLKEKFNVFSRVEIYYPDFGEGILKIYLRKDEDVERYLNFLNANNVKPLLIRKLPPSLSDIYSLLIEGG